MPDRPTDKGASAHPMVEFRNASIGYDGRPVVQDVSIRIHPGEFVGIIGPSGAGKTTLLRGLIGNAAVYRGEVLVDGRRVGARHRPAVGYVPQISAIDWTFPISVEEAVLLSRASQSWGPFARREEREQMLTLLEQLGIADLRKRHIRDLSGGQQQRVFLARALLRNSRLVILDEPTTGVDIKTRDDLLHLLADLNGEGTTIVLSTHETNAVAAHLPRVICLNKTVVADGAPEKTFTPEVLARTYNAPIAVLHQDGMVMVVETPHEFREALHSHTHEHVHRHVHDHPAGDHHDNGHGERARP